MFGVVVLAGCSSAPRQPEADGAARIATVYVIDRGWHADIGLPAGDVRGPLAAIGGDFPGVRHLLFGFGDRAYLLSPHRSMLGMIAALFPGPGAMLVTALRATPEEAFGRSHVVALAVTGAGFDRIVSFVWNGMSRTDAGLPVRIADGPYPGSAFYASGMQYDLVYTCNTWVAAALQAAGLPIRAAGVVFAGQVMSRARAVGR